jgi:hypothetical protein
MHDLQDNEGRFGLVPIRISAGQDMAILIKNLLR